MHRAAVAEPREPLLRAVLDFVRSITGLQGVRRIALIGSLTTRKPVPKDADLLVTIAEGIDLKALAGAGRRLKGRAQSLNCGADIFLASETHEYLGRTCRYREPWHRRVCGALICGQQYFLCNDFRVLKLAPELVREPPLELWPKVVRRLAPPEDLDRIVISPFEAASAPQ